MVMKLFRYNIYKDSDPDSERPYIAKGLGFPVVVHARNLDELRKDMAEIIVAHYDVFPKSRKELLDAEELEVDI